MTKRPQIGHDRTSGQEIANDEVGQHLQGGQGQVGGPQVPLLGHGNEIKSPNKRVRHSDACEPWEYVAPVVAAVVAAT